MDINYNSMEAIPFANKAAAIAVSHQDICIKEEDVKKILH